MKKTAFTPANNCDCRLNEYNINWECVKKGGGGMNTSAYELLAMGMRYVFAGLMLLIVLRALRGALTDSRRAAKLRRLSPETGIIGEMLVVDGSERARTGMRYPLTLEGSIGSSPSADIRVRHSSIRARHAVYQMTERGLYVRGHANARIRRNRDPWASEILLHDGDILRIGGVRLMLVLTEANELPEELERRIHRRDLTDFGIWDRRSHQNEGTDEDVFDADELFRSNPASGFSDDMGTEENEATHDDTGYFSTEAGQSIFEPDESDGGFDPVHVPRQRDSAADHRRYH